MDKIIYIVTSPEQGWDCIVGAYSSVESLIKCMELPSVLKTYEDVDNHFNKLKTSNLIVHKQHLI